jgi:hypothetical protein
VRNEEDEGEEDFPEPSIEEMLDGKIITFLFVLISW